ncbi:hypothetical protein [Legionella sp. CNM-4043-24]|uniref:hypothetical protein n=1 Tax=Legionella sp. CNM-4043-24 TaxID=3421646 RepID=UPI00403AD256
MHFYVTDSKGLSIAQGSDAASMQSAIDALEQYPSDRQPFVLCLSYPGKDKMARISFGRKDDGHWYSRFHFSQTEDPILDSLPILRMTADDTEFDVPLHDETFADDLKIFIRLRSRYEYTWALRENLERRGLLTLCEQLDTSTLCDLRRACILINERQRKRIEPEYREKYYRTIRVQAAASARQFDLTGDRDTIFAGVTRFQSATKAFIEAELGK